MGEHIASAAITYTEGRTVSVPPPGRHHTCFAEARKRGWPLRDHREQGFLTDRGRFVDRKEAWRIAEAAGQLLPIAPTDHRGGTLYSEDVW